MRHPEQLAALREPLDDAARPRRRTRAAARRSRSPTARRRTRRLDRAARPRTGASCCGSRPRTSSSPTPLDGRRPVGAALADLAGAALDASLRRSRARRRRPSAARRSEVAATRLAIIGMGKAGARELNYLSDVDVIFVAETRRGRRARASTSRTRLAMDTMRGIAELALEPPLWEVDANLRPEGKDGALVRTPRLAPRVLRPLGEELGVPGAAEGAAARRRPRARRARTSPAWPRRSGRARRARTSSTRCSGCASGSPSNIPADEVDVQLKLGPGGLRDVEFTIQLLQLVHGQADAGGAPARRRSEALDALADQGYIGRVEAAEFARDYRVLRLLEHRLQLRAAAPHPPDAARRGRAAGARPGDRARPTTRRAARRARGSARKLRGARRCTSGCSTGRCSRRSPRCPRSGYALTSEQAEARLAAIGFRDPRGRAAPHRRPHRRACRGARRSSAHLLPVMLQWFAEGADPDYGLLAFRRLSDDLGEAYWFLRMLRDSSGAAHRLTHVLSGSRFVGDPVRAHPRGGGLARERRASCGRARSTSCSRRRRRPSPGTRDDPDAAATRPADRPPPGGAAPGARRASWA